MDDNAEALEVVGEFSPIRRRRMTDLEVGKMLLAEQKRDRAAAKKTRPKLGTRKQRRRWAAMQRKAGNK